MSQVLFLPHFLKQTKKLQKRYRGFQDGLIAELEAFNPDRTSSLGSSLYKVRFTCMGLSKGKSGSFRGIVYYFLAKDVVIPVMAYFKGHHENVSRNDIEFHLQKILVELQNYKFL